MNRLEELTDKYLSHLHEGRVLMNHDDLLEYVALQHAKIESFVAEGQERAAVWKSVMDRIGDMHDDMLVVYYPGSAKEQDVPLAKNLPTCPQCNWRCNLCECDTETVMCPICGRRFSRETGKPVEVVREPESVPPVAEASTRPEKPRTLLANKVAVGHCVIIKGDYSSAERIAVVTQVKGKKTAVRYFKKNPSQKHTMNGDDYDLMPVNRFGIQVRQCGQSFWCELDKNLIPIARLSDNRPWFWHQGSNLPQRFRARKKVLAVALVALRNRGESETSPRITPAEAHDVALSHTMTLAQARDLATSRSIDMEADRALVQYRKAASILNDQLTRIEPVVAAAREWRDRRHCVNETILLDAVDAAGEGESIG